MVGHEPNKVTLTPTDISRVTADIAVISRFVVNPLDVIKIRFQLQHEPINKRLPISKYRGIIQCATTILREEGLLAFWKGHLTSQMLPFAYIGTRFLWLDGFTRLSTKVYKDSLESEQNKIITHLVSAGAATICSIASVYPLEVIRTRLVSQGEPKHYQGIRDAFRQIYRTEGFRGFYRGISAAFFCIPGTALKLGLCQTFNSIFCRPSSPEGSKQNLIGSPVMQSLINSFLAGVISKFIIYPIDLAKTRLQIRGFEEARLSFGQVVSYRGLLDCLVSTYRLEGPKALYKGMAPSLLMSGINTCLCFLMLETVFDRVKSKPVPDSKNWDTETKW